MADNTLFCYFFRMPKLIDLTGERFERLLVLERADVPTVRPQWVCLCDCGQTVTVRGGDLRAGNHRSCGCLHSDWVEKNLTKHGLSRHRIYIIWQGMLRRCEVPTYSKFKNYGGRGIKICSRWHTFTKFVEDMGLPPSDEHTLDRIDVNGNYELRNCRWATDTEQRNNKRDSNLHTYDGRTQTVTQWADEIGTRGSSITWRLRKGHSFADIIEGRVAVPKF